jgi:hypothetical protein
MFDHRLLPPRVIHLQQDFAACNAGYRPGWRFYFSNDRTSTEWLWRRGVPLEGIPATSHVSASLAIPFPDGDPSSAPPFAHLRGELAGSDVCLVNLECPLAESGRPIRNEMTYRASPAYATALAEANIRIVSFANNHCFDYGDAAFIETLAHLRNNGVHYLGAGETLAAARNPVIERIAGMTVAFLGYNAVGPDVVYASAGECGVAPFNEIVVLEDLEKVRLRADLVVVSVHWGDELVPIPHRNMIAAGHFLIDSGVDVVLGHHQHLPGAIEWYRDKVICYSLGNLVFGHSHTTWADGVIAHLDFDGARLTGIELVPVGGPGIGQWQPRMLDPDAALHVIDGIRLASRLFGTNLEFIGSRARCTAPPSVPLAEVAIQQQ